MKSTWVAAGLVLLTICQAAKDDPPPESMVFDKINYIDDGNDPRFKICLTDAVPVADSFQAVVDIESREYSMASIEIEGTQCIIFYGDIKQWEFYKIYIFIAALTEDDTVTDWGEAHFPSFPEFPTESLTASYADDPLATENGFIVLRVEGALNDMTNINELVPTRPTVDDIHYYIGDIDPTTLIPCSDTEPKVCDAVLTAVKTTTPGPDVGSVILTYSQGEQMGRITGKVSSTILTDQDQLKVIISTEDNTIAQFCQGPYSETLSCEINWDNPGEKTAQIRLMGITTDGMTEIKGIEIQDRELIINQLDSDILEGQWIMHESEKDNPKYRLTVNAETADVEVNYMTVNVDCTHATTHCFGYIPMDTSVTAYTFTVTNKNSLDGSYNQLEQIQTTKTVSASHPSQDLQIHDLPMEWHQNLMEVNTTICFSHETPNEEMIFSHYEMVLINTKGQWLKHKVMEEDDNDDVLCFTPFTINTQEFDVTEGVKVVVSQRASDGVSVIASGGSTLF